MLIQGAGGGRDFQIAPIWRQVWFCLSLQKLAQRTISKIVGGVRMVIPVFSGLSYTITVLPFHNWRVSFESVEIALEHYRALLEIIGHFYQVNSLLPIKIFQGSRQVPRTAVTFLPQDAPMSVMVLCDQCLSGQVTQWHFLERNNQEGIWSLQQPKGLAGQWPQKGFCVWVWGRSCFFGWFPHLLRTHLFRVA